MKVISKICLVLYLLLWTLSGLYFGNAGIINNEYFKEIDNIPREEFKKIPVDTDARPGTADSAVKYKVFKGRNGILYGTQGDLRAAEIQEKIKYKWLFEESEALILILASCFLGALGSIIRIVKDLVVDNVQVSITRFLLLPVAGFFNGFIVLSISYAIPKYLTNNEEVNLNPASVMVISLIAGIYIEIFLTWLNSVAISLFKKNENQQK